MLGFRLRRLGVLFVSWALVSLGGCGTDDPATNTAPLAPGGSGGASGVAGTGTRSGSPGSNGVKGGASRAGASGSGAGGSTSAPQPSGSSDAGSDGQAEVPAVPQPPPGPLPDLVLDAAYLLDTTREDTVDVEDLCLVAEGCVGGPGERRVVRFGSKTGNIGDADLQLGFPEPGNGPWTNDECHDDGAELVGFGIYELIDRSTGVVVASSVKNGFCVADSEPIEGYAEEGDESCNRYDCRDQGISQSCADNYGAELECQWVDITDVPPGSYVMRATVNGSRKLVERDYDNNHVDVNLEISADEVLVER
jgi:hypothetical protein